MIFTHTGKLGDFFFSLPVANWYYKISDEKVHYVVSSDFDMFNKILPDFSKYINCIEKISFVPHKILNYDCGGQPYKFDPSKYGIEGKYLNLGYKHFPNKYCANFIAEEHGFDVDYANLFNIEPDRNMLNKKVYTNEYDFIKPKIENIEEYEELSFKDPLHINISKMLSCSKIITFHSGFAAICDMLNPNALYIYAASSISTYGKVFFKHNDFYVKNNRYLIYN